MAVYPTRGDRPWGAKLKAYIDTAAAAVGTALSPRLDAVEETLDDGRLSEDAIAARDARNILDHGVVRGTSATQTAAIKAALDAYPGEAFYFPPGDYRLNTTLAVTKNNSLVLAPGARIYAGAAMGTLIDYDNGLTVSNYTQDKGIYGSGLLDANLLANKALAIGSVIRFSVPGLTIKNPINRGLWLKPAGAEVIVNDLRIYNTGTTNVADNWAIEADMGDCVLSDVVTRDFTNGIWDKGSNVWNDVHPWIGTTAQLTARYANSVAFLLDSDSTLTRPYADTYRTAFRTVAASGYRRVRISDPRIFYNTGNLTPELASANVGTCYNLADGAEVQVRGGTYTGASTPCVFVSGNTIRFNHRDWIDRIPGSITGLGEYKRGVKFGRLDFSPTLYGHVAGLGSVVFSTRTGRMDVGDGVVTYTGRIVGTLGADAAGNYRIGSIPMPPGATTVSLADYGVLSRRKGLPTAAGLYGVNGTSGSTLIGIVYDGVGAEVAVTPSVAFDVHFVVVCPFTYPS